MISFAASNRAGRGPCVRAGGGRRSSSTRPGPSPAGRFKISARSAATPWPSRSARGPGLVHRRSQRGRDRPPQHPPRHHARHAARGGSLAIVPARVQVDGNRCPPARCAHCEAVVKNDSLVPRSQPPPSSPRPPATRCSSSSTAATPIRPRRPRGYPTAAHLAALKAHGACEIYRTSFGPVRDIIANPPLWTDGRHPMTLHHLMLFVHLAGVIVGSAA